MKSQLRKLALLIPGLRHQILTLDMLEDIATILKQLQFEVARLPTIQATCAAEAAFRQSERYRDTKRLLGFTAKINSQNGEDGIIAEIFRRIRTTTKTFVEIGVEDGRECNTAFLLACGWSGFWIDSDPSMNDTLQAMSNSNRDHVKAITVMVTAENVISNFQNSGIPRELDLLSIDIDQNTYYIWEALADYRPRVVVVEYNAALPPSVDWKVNYSPDRMWDGSQNFGASLKAFERLGNKLGYKLVGCDYTGTNAFFVREDLVQDAFSAPFDAENHYEPNRPQMLSYRIHPSGILDRSVSE